MLRRFFLRRWYRLIGKTPADMECVHYWKVSDHTEGMIKEEDGVTVMYMLGEKYPMWGLPRGHLLIPHTFNNQKEAKTLDERVKKFGAFSVLKHELKEVFNEAWWKLERGVNEEEVIAEGKTSLDKALEHLKPLYYDLLPPTKLGPAVREIHRAWTKVQKNERSRQLKEALCLIAQEDDGYRYRIQYLAGWMPFIKWNPIKILETGLKMVEYAEVTEDMKIRIRLLRKIVLLALKDPSIKEQFLELFKEINWKKLRLSKGDKYHLRAKYFKADMDVLEY